MSSGIPFEKWQGLGNHYVVTDSADWSFPITPERARLVCDANFGVGSDGILEVVREGAIPEMRVWNPDGSMAENCGNGIRMVSRYLAGRGQLPADGRVLTGAGEVRVSVDGSVVSVDMGHAVFPAGEGDEPLATGAGDVSLTEVSMGNPHAVIRHADPDSVVHDIGPLVERAERFPQRTNVEFVRRDGPSEMTMRVWERGAGVTMACGTGACAAAVAGVRLDGMQSPVTVHLAGGDLVIDVADDLRVTMTGPADPIYSGRFSADLMSRLEAM
ncbi:MAG: diaminopimelate epimerase [Thermoleophilia bacterium]|nr:diaminopimelate epimerase [Thermoleophilia bacterium]